MKHKGKRKKAKVFRKNLHELSKLIASIAALIYAIAQLKQR